MSSVDQIGPIEMQLFVCYDRVRCTVGEVLGDGLAGGDILKVSLVDSECDPRTDGLRSFPNRGVSVPSRTGKVYDFGENVVNVTNVPQFYRLCWIRNRSADTIILPSGILRIDSFEFYYRQKVASNDWSPLEASWKIWILSLLIPLSVVTIYIFGFLLERAPGSLEHWESDSGYSCVVFSRISSNPLDPGTEAHLNSLQDWDPSRTQDLISSRRSNNFI